MCQPDTGQRFPVLPGGSKLNTSLLVRPCTASTGASATALRCQGARRLAPLAGASPAPTEEVELDVKGNPARHAERNHAPRDVLTGVAPHPVRVPCGRLMLLGGDLP